MGIFTIFTAAFAIFQMNKDFKKDKGLFKKAKGFHMAFVILICLTYGGAIRHLGWALTHFNRFVDRHSTKIGIIDGDTHFYISIIHQILVIVLLIITYQIATRNDTARKRINFILPFLALTESFNFYRGWLRTGPDPETAPLTIFLIGGIAFGIIATSMILIYSSQFMKDFFEAKNYNPAADFFNNESSEG